MRIQMNIIDEITHLNTIFRQSINSSEPRLLPRSRGSYITRIDRTYSESVPVPRAFVWMYRMIKKIVGTKMNSRLATKPNWLVCITVIPIEYFYHHLD